MLSMRRAAWALIVATGLLAVAVLPAAARQRPSQPPPGGVIQQPPAAAGTGQLSGTIRSAADESTLGRARVTAVTEALAEPRVTISAADGKYNFTDLPAGAYVVTATRTGFAPQAYGQGRGTDGKPITVVNGGTTGNIDILLTPGGVIAGRILDEDGSPFAGAIVDALITHSDKGADVLVSVSTSYTDDQGNYRLFGLVPGQYYVSASDPAFRAVSTAAGVLHYSPTYFPGVVFANEAKTLVVPESGPPPRAEFRIKLVPPARVSGQLISYDRRQLLSGAVIMSPLDGEGVPMVPPSDVSITPDGHFIFGEVVPGRYQIRARGQTDPAGNALFAVHSVLVDGSDLDGIAMTLQPGALLDGEVQFEARHGTHAPPADTLRVRAPFTDGNNFGDALTGIVGADGKYAIRGIMTGAHQLAIEDLPPPWVLKQISFQGANITDIALDIAERQVYRDVRIVLTDDGSVLSGRVRNSRHLPVADVGIIVFPSTPLFWLRTNRRLRIVYTDSAGSFVVAGLPAGEYLAIAAHTIDASDLGTADRLEALEKAAVAFTIPADNAKVSVDLPLVTLTAKSTTTTVR